VVSASFAISAASADPRSQTLVERQHLLVELDAPAGPLRVQAADELRVLAQVLENAPGEHALGGEDEVEVLALRQAGELLDHRLPAGAGRANGQRGLVADERARGEVRGEAAGRGLHPAEVGLPGRVVDEQRDDDDDRVRAGDGVGVVGGGAQPARRDERAQLLLEVRLAGERLDGGVDRVDHALLHVDAHDVVPHLCELDRQRQPDLAHRDDGNLHVSPSRLGACESTAMTFVWCGHRTGRGCAMWVWTALTEIPRAGKDRVRATGLTFAGSARGAASAYVTALASLMRARCICGVILAV
jgi:hypothetical protein